MKRQFLLIITALVLVSLYSCSSYKNTATTTDDVYYSPNSTVPTTVKPGSSSDYYSTPNDNYVTMRVQDPEKWSYFDDYNYDYYGNTAYGYGSGIGYGMGFGMGFGFGMPYWGGFGYYSPMSYYNSYYAWNNFYNPYYGTVIVVNGKNTTSPSYARMSNFNPTAYKGLYYNSRPNITNLSPSSHQGQDYFNSRSNGNSFNHPNTNFSPGTRATFSNGGGGFHGGGGFSRGR
jgi:hypothetical protein